MRSSAIAEEMISRGLQTIFVGQVSNMPWLEDYVKKLGYLEVYSDSKEFKSNPTTDTLIIDSYSISAEDQFIQPENWVAVVNIFDQFTPQYKSQLRIHPGFEDNWELIPGTPILYGAKFIPLRTGIYKKKNSLDSKLAITITAGGSDSNNFVGAVTEILSTSKIDFQATVYTNRNLLSVLDDRFQVKKLGRDFDVTMSQTDLAFTTASTTCLEFLATGAAVAVGCSIENQAPNYIKLGQLGVVSQIGKCSDEYWQLKSHLILELTSSESLRSNLKEKAENFIDLNGASRIVDAIVLPRFERDLEKSKVHEGN